MSSNRREKKKNQLRRVKVGWSFEKAAQPGHHKQHHNMQKNLFAARILYLPGFQWGGGPILLASFKTWDHTRTPSASTGGGHGSRAVVVGSEDLFAPCELPVEKPPVECCRSRARTGVRALCGDNPEAVPTTTEPCASCFGWKLGARGRNIMPRPSCCPSLVPWCGLSSLFSALLPTCEHLI